MLARPRKETYKPGHNPTDTGGKLTDGQKSVNLYTALQASNKKKTALLVVS